MQGKYTASDKPNIFSHVFDWLKEGIHDLFRPEEVEVTFKVEGNKVRYTYTKVEEKKVA